jgi:hypothetical protein
LIIPVVRKTQVILVVEAAFYSNMVFSDKRLRKIESNAHLLKGNLNPLILTRNPQLETRNP